MLQIIWKCFPAAPISFFLSLSPPLSLSLSSSLSSSTRHRIIASESTPFCASNWSAAKQSVRHTFHVQCAITSREREKVTRNKKGEGKKKPKGRKKEEEEKRGKNWLSHLNCWYWDVQIHLRRLALLRTRCLRRRRRRCQTTSINKSFHPRSQFKSVS